VVTLWSSSRCFSEFRSKIALCTFGFFFSSLLKVSFFKIKRALGKFYPESFNEDQRDSIFYSMKINVILSPVPRGHVVVIMNR
jgi:hypothetical protein